MRIGILIEYPTLNGGERSMLAVLRQLRRLNLAIDPAVLAPPSGPLAAALRTEQIEHRPLSLHDERGQRLPLDECASLLAASLSTAKFDLVHSNSLSLSRLLGRICGGLNCPATGHVRDIVRLSGAAMADLNNLTQLIAVSRATSEFHAAQGLHTGLIEVICNGVDLNEFSPRPATGRLRSQLALPESSLLIGTIGQIGLRKGQDVLADAALLLRARPELHFVVAGERSSAKRESIEYERSFIDRFEQSGMRDRLHLLGYRTDIAELFGEIDILVHPAHQEPLGRVLLEAAAAGKAIVATDVGGTREILQDGVSGRIVRAGDPAALSAAIAELAGNAAQRKCYGAAARRAAEERFAIEKAARKTWDFWQRWR